jgi:5-methyltetrahydropteroyltriglutamate--homocysteine methyltransferase
VIAASAISLIYPGDGIDGYPQEQFVADLVNEAGPAAALEVISGATSGRTSGSSSG